MPLRTHRAGCFWGPESGPMTRWLDAVTRVGAPVKRLSVGEARGVFPAFRFEDDDLILRDESAAVIHAAQTLRALAGRGKALGGVIAEGGRLLELEPRPGRAFAVPGRYARPQCITPARHYFKPQVGSNLATPRFSLQPWSQA